MLLLAVPTMSSFARLTTHATLSAESTMQQRKKLVSACAIQNGWLQVGPCWFQRPLFSLREHVAAHVCVQWPSCLATNLYL